MKEEAMKKIKCPICHEEKGLLRYNQNRIYLCHCQNPECRERVTVTTSSEVEARTLMAGFEQNGCKTDLRLPQHLAQKLEGYKDKLESEDIEDFMFGSYGSYDGEACASYNVIKAYLNPETKHLVEVYYEQTDS